VLQSTERLSRHQALTDYISCLAADAMSPELQPPQRAKLYLALRIAGHADSQPLRERFLF